ncbi:MAG: PQQ-binding-like beta-propeller repeat protein [Planctomycetaceae bacterium]|nr:PQQ-binding-like beta-propeller repeat protein [Planctomycetaceae bacterium]
MAQRETQGLTKNAFIRYFGDYELLSEIARGGMGVVYKARQVKLNRIVALKMILSGELASQEMVQRFQTEAEAAARLEHPGIVPVFEIGRHEGQHYFSMAYINGPSLAAVVAQGPLPPRDAATLTKIVSTAMGYAHDRGVIHRDLKPANLLLAKVNDQRESAVFLKAEGLEPGWYEPKVTDFGLAKVSEGDSQLTGTGQVMGTPSYMPPEQPSGQIDVMGPLTDVYSLGGILYCLLTGRPPFQSDNVMDTLRQVVDDDPVPVRRLNPAVPIDLETVCAKCLEKSPSKRYGSANDLGQELERFLEGRPIEARPVGRVEQAWRWCRRNRVVAMLLALVLFVLVGGLAGIGWAYGIALENERKAVENEVAALAQKEMAELKTDEALAAKTVADSQRDRADTEKQRAEAELLRAEWQIYISNLREAQLALDFGDFGTAKNRLNACRWDFRGWEHDHLFTRLHHGCVTLNGHSDSVKCVAVSPDGKRIVSGVGRAVPDGKHDPRRSAELKVWDAVTGKPIFDLIGHTNSIQTVAFSPDGRMIASGSRDRTVRLWDAATGQLRHKLIGHRNWINRVVFSSDGKWLISGGFGYDTIKVWNVDTGRLIKTIGNPREMYIVWGVSISPDGKRVLSGQRGRVHIFDFETAKIVTSLSWPGSNECASFNLQGDRILSVGMEGIAVWDAKTENRLFEISGRTFTSAYFSPDGRSIVSSDRDGSVKVWNAADGSSAKTLRGHQYPATDAVFMPDCRRVVSCSGDKTVKVWDLTAVPSIQLHHQEEMVHSVAFSPDGTKVASGNEVRNIYVYNSADGKVSTRMVDVENLGIDCVAFGRDNTTLITGHRGDRVQVWDLKTKTSRLMLRGHSGGTNSLSVGPQGMRVASGGADKTVKLWNVETRALLWTARNHTDKVTCVSFAPDGRFVFTASRDDTICILDANDGTAVQTLSGHTDDVMCVSTSPDGTVVASGSNDQTIRLWDVASGQLLRTFHGHGGGVISVCFNPDGTRILSGSSDSTIRVWDTSSARELLVLRGHSGPVRASLSSDGRHLVSGSADSTVRLWSAEIRQETLPLPRNANGDMRVAFSSDQGVIFAETSDGRFSSWSAITGKILRENITPASVEFRQQAISADGRRIVLVQNGELVVRPQGRMTELESAAKERLSQWSKFDLDWHQEQASLAGTANDAFGRSFHLDRISSESTDREIVGARSQRENTLATELPRLRAEDAYPAVAEKPRTNWSQFGFDLRNTGYNSSETKIGTENVAKLELLWTHFTGATSYANPVVVDDVVYHSDYSSWATALDANTGKLVWKKPIRGSSGGAAVANGIVYYASRHQGHLYAIRCDTGQVAWDTPLDSTNHAPPKVHNNVLYVGTKLGTLYAVNATSGRVIWTFSAGGTVKTPTIAGDMILFPCGNGDLCAVKLSSGEKVWSAELGHTVLSVAVHRDIVYAGVAEGGVAGFNLRTGNRVFSSEIADLTAYSTAVAEGLIYVGTSDSQLYCIDATSGKTVWASTVDGIVPGRPTIANGVVYASNKTGDVFLYAFDAENGEKLFKHPLYSSKYPTDTTPIVADGRLYISATWGRRLIAFHLPNQLNHLSSNRSK